MTNRTPDAPFRPDDLDQLSAHGIDRAEAERQFAALRGGYPDIQLDRPATLGDGIAEIAEDEHAGLVALHRAAIEAGRCMKFVPASGAASRMFQSLLSVRNEPEPVADDQLRQRSAAGDTAAADVLRFVEHLEQLPFAAELAAAAQDADRRTILARLLDPGELGYATLPKGLIPFHSYADGARTPFEEQLVETGLYAMADDGRARLHFTVAAEHRGLIQDHVAAGIARLGPAAARLSVEYSLQHPGTDTIALDARGEPFRTEDDKILLRPGGHGSLLQNLNELNGDIVFLKNIDNVAPLAQANAAKLSKALLCGELLRVQATVHDWLRSWHQSDPDPEQLQRIEHFAAARLGVILPPALADRAAALRRILDRPIRVCGMVRNEGEPGGGPYWVRAGDGSVSLQIIEASQIRRDIPEQAAVMSRATHFNPVDLVCAVRDWRGEPFDLADFVDPETGFIAEKSKDGTVLKALERPGLWNGAMADWNTIFVEVPIETFTPVKTVLDLLRPEHQTG